MKTDFAKALLALVIFFSVCIIGCKRESVLENPIDPILPPPPPTTITVVNDLTQVSASVSGIVLDESNAPIASAVVTSGAATTTTNSNGMFVFQSISLSKENGSVTVVKAGYFKGVRSFKTTAGKNHTVRLQLMQRVLSGSINAGTGGSVNSNGGATIIFPASSFVTSSGAAYTGVVNVYSRWIDPTAANLSSIIPGDLRGVGTNGAENILETYGMLGAELTDASGNLLKVAVGKKAAVNFPIPASLQASAPATIKLWHFDETTARWKENGIATKIGNTYNAQVDKFSFWNCDLDISAFIYLEYTLINATTNTPFAGTKTSLKRISNGRYGFGITNNEGYISGLVPKNEAFILEVTSYTCGTVLYSQNIGPFPSNTNLGNINIVIPSSQILNFSGTLLNCNNTPVTNGYLMLFSNSGGSYASINNAGNFAFSIINCSGLNIPYNYQGFDGTTSQQSNLLSGNAANGNINLGNINVCSVSNNVDVYVTGCDQTSYENRTAKLWKNGLPINLSNGNTRAIANSVFVTGNDVYIVGSEGLPAISSFDSAVIWKNGTKAYLTGGGVSSASANSIFISGTDIYVAGALVAEPIVWKNGVPLNSFAPSNPYIFGNASSVFISGNDVYASGTGGTSPYPSTVLRFWKNGISTTIANMPNQNGNAKIFVSGSDVYVACKVSMAGGTSKAQLWKNGLTTNLDNGANNSGANNVFVSGSDTYVVGFQGTSAILWKNGIPSSLPGGTMANGVYVFGTDVYVVGYGNAAGSGSSVPLLWKNGVRTDLPIAINSSGFATSVFVK